MAFIFPSCHKSDTTQGTSENAHPYLQKEHRLLPFVHKVLSFSEVKQNITAKDSANNLITDMSAVSKKKIE